MLTDTFINDTIQINLATCLDISGYPNFAIKYRKPDGTVGCWIATLCAGDDECITYTTALGDLDQSGEWLIQAIATNVGASLHGTWASFYVHKPLLATCPSLTVAPTTLVPTTTLTTVPPTTVPPTVLPTTVLATLVPSTLLASTLAPTTALTTAPPTTSEPTTTPPATTSPPTTTGTPATTPSPTTGAIATTTPPTTGAI